MLNMSELNDNPELQKYSSAVLQVMSGVYVPAAFAEAVLEKLAAAIQFSKVSKQLSPAVKISWACYSPGASGCIHYQHW